ncbi:MAG: hypothetical protein AB1765_12655 [Candidatus Hydrogenedentota bacterium]
MIEIDEKRIKKIAKFFKDNKKFKPFNFTGKYLPEVGHPLALDFFFVLSKHQFGFWYNNSVGYERPMIVEIEGEKLKGSDFIWRVGMRMIKERPEFFKEKYQSNITLDILNQLWRCDKGFCPLPTITAHLILMQTYGKEMIANNFTPLKLVEEAKKEKAPSIYLRDSLRKIGGYKEDPLSKKINMLIMILQNRPEKFIKKEDIPPIIDYHIQRLSLRTGMVKISSVKLRDKIIHQRFVLRDEEMDIRNCIFGAIQMLKTMAKVGTPEIDWLFFQGRNYCPEMTRPECDRCLLSDYCEKNIELFQPVYRTTFY